MRRFLRVGLRSLVVALSISITCAAQIGIEISGLPSYGSAGQLTGRVQGVDFATHRVAVYIQVEGSGWWTRPSPTQPVVAIRSDGTFAVTIGSGVLDDRATIFAAALLAPGVSPPIAAGSGRVPSNLVSLAIAFAPRYGRTLQFGGRAWAVKESPVPVGPGGNVFSNDPNDVWVDARGQLHLVLRFRGGRWWGAELMSVETFGHGTFWFTTESQLEDLDPNLTFGAFTWDPYGDDVTIPAAPHREIDFEDSRWGQASDTTTSQVVVQPYQVPGNLQRFRLPDLAAAPTITRYFTWTRDLVEFVAARGRHSPCSIPSGDVMFRSVFTHAPARGNLVPTAGRTRFHFNLWINGGGAPRNGQEAEVIVSDFRYAPIPGTFPGGCGVNPTGSLLARAGSTSVGDTLVLAIDNPSNTQASGSPTALLIAFAPSPWFPCGVLMPGLGMRGSFGELQVELGAGLVTWSAGTPWNGPGSPALIPLAIPPLASIVGRSLFAQGAILDLAPAARRAAGLTDAIELCIRP
ncbi:MAG: hypothetical protein AB7T19_19580 [Planctomycetota bacterium]